MLILILTNINISILIYNTEQVGITSRSICSPNMGEMRPLRHLGGGCHAPRPLEGGEEIGQEEEEACDT